MNKTASRGNQAADEKQLKEFVLISAKVELVAEFVELASISVEITSRA